MTITRSEAIHLWRLDGRKAWLHFGKPPRVVIYRMPEPAHYWSPYRSDAREENVEVETIVFEITNRSDGTLQITCQGHSWID